MYTKNELPEFVYKTKYKGDNSLAKDLKSQFTSKGIDTLKFKQGVRVMLLRNLSVSEGFVNGSTGVVTNLDKDSVTVKFDHNQSSFTVKGCEWSRTSLTENINAVAVQIPLMLAFASNYHKIQGSTIHVPVYMNLADCFTYHQVYTAVSRVDKLENLFLLSFNPNKIIVNKQVSDFYEQ
jgi:ATP-dependent exoDNAse (exonuclease V) alpha subunit